MSVDVHVVVDVKVALDVVCVKIGTGLGIGI